MLGAGAALALAVGLTANWRLALLASLAAAAIAVTRVRYARLCALLALGGVLGLAAAGASAGTDQRTSHQTAAASRCADVVRGGLRVDGVHARGASCSNARRVGRAWLGVSARRAAVRGYRCRGQRQLRCRRHAARISGTVSPVRR